MTTQRSTLGKVKRDANLRFAPSEPGDLPNGPRLTFLRRTENMHGPDPSFPPNSAASLLSAMVRGPVAASERPGTRVTT